MTAPTTDPEATLREMWTKAGVPKERQDALVADVTAKAQPGAQVGPWTIPTATDRYYARPDVQKRMRKDNEEYDRRLNREWYRKHPKPDAETLQMTL